ncbi:MAG: exonuclease SbcCD subunit D [bacterium]
MKILHFSDLHLDMAFTGSGMPLEIARGCRMRLRKTLHHILDLAVEKKVDVVTVGGDLFEGDRVSRDTIQFLTGCFEQLAPIPVLIAPGNHDYYSPVSPYSRHTWPENVTLFGKPIPESFEFSGEVTFWGIGHHSPSERKNFIENFKVPQDDKLHILLMHGSEIGKYVENRAAHAPFNLRDIEEAGFGFGLLGHYHSARILEIDRPIAVYPGSPQQLGFGDDGERGVAILTVQRDFIECECIDIATQAFISLEFSPKKSTDTHNLAEEIVTTAGKRTAEANFLRLRLSGIQGSGLHIDIDYLKDFLLNYFEHVSIDNAMRSSANIEELSQEPTVRGAFVRQLQQMLSDNREDQELIRQALKYGLHAFEGEDLVK